MSAEAVGWVYRHSPYKGQFLAVHLAIADVVNDQANNQFWMTLPRLALKARVDRGTAKKAIDSMCSTDEWGDAPFLRLVHRSTGGRSRPSTYQFLFPDVPVLYETRVTDAGSGWETRVGGTKPASHAPKPAHGTRGIKPNDPNEQADLKFVCPSPVCDQRFATIDERDLHYENCVDPDFIPAESLPVSEASR